jgi:hypothetical protein
MKKHWKIFMVLPVFMVGLGACFKSNFFEDVDDPGLSRFTSRGYNVASAYINNEAWVNYFNSASGPSPMLIFLDTATTAKDSLYLQWEGDINNSLFSERNRTYLTISLPVKRGFSVDDFLNWNAKSFPSDSTTVTISLGDFSQPNSGLGISGKGKIYFVNIQQLENNPNIFELSGLFEGNIGDSVIIKKGRFDYRSSIMNFH